MNLLTVWFSRTGTTRKAAAVAEDQLRSRGHRITDAALHPRWDLPYPFWLALSFLPGSRTPLSLPLPDPSGHDACLLALPKWTFSCPPVNAFLARAGATLPPTAVLLTCGGWDQERYLRDLEARLARLGVRVLGGLILKRKQVEAGAFAGDLGDFLGKCFPEPGIAIEVDPVL